MKKITIFAVLTAAISLASCSNKAETSAETPVVADSVGTVSEDSVGTMNLREAYNALSKIPNVSTVTHDTISISIDKSADYHGTLQIAEAHNLDREEIFKSGNATLAILNQIPLFNMINGGKNRLVSAFVYCAPNASGSNDMLIVTLNGPQGNLTYVFIPDVDNNTMMNLTEAPLIMQSESVSIIPQKSDGNVNIGAINVNCN